MAKGCYRRQGLACGEPCLRDIDGAVVVIGWQAVKELERRAVETARIGGNHRHLIKIRKHAVEKRVHAKEWEDLARAGEENDVPRRVRLGLLKDVRGDFLRRGELGHVLEHALGTAALLLAWDGLKDTALFENCQHGVVEVHDLERARKLVGLGIA